MTSSRTNIAASLGPGGEFDIIRAMAARWGARAVGLGDDAAVMSVPRGDSLVASVDTAIEGRHFRREWLSPRDIGRRAINAALSDLAAMAATPLGVLVALAVPTEWRASLLDIADGINDALTSAGTVIRGGNISAAAELSITTTALGSVHRALTRSGLRPGDRIYVTGELGGPQLTIDALSDGATPPELALARFVNPAPRLAESRWLAARGATAAIDISDGLGQDLRHLAAASTVRIEVDLQAVPRLPGVSARDAVVSGEEYELIVGAAGELDVVGFSRQFGIPLTEIGRAIGLASDGPGVDLMEGGTRVAIPGGHDHLSN
jgi:thiamine-monophosphate kinase